MLVPKNVFAVGKVAAKEQGRYAINGVCLGRTPDGRPLAVATDGKRLVAATWAEGKAEELPADLTAGQDIKAETIVGLETWNEIGKNVPKKAPRPNLKQAVVGIEGRQVQAVSTDMTNTRRSAGLVVEGAFPKWRQVVPRQDKPMCISFNPKYLAEVAEVVAEAAGVNEDNPVVTLAIEDFSRPALLVAKGPNGTAVGVLMPVAKQDDNRKPIDQAAFVRKCIAELAEGEIAKALAETPKKGKVYASSHKSWKEAAEAACAEPQIGSCCKATEPQPCASCEAEKPQTMPDVGQTQESPAEATETPNEYHAELEALRLKVLEIQAKTAAINRENEALAGKVQQVNRAKRLAERG